MEANQSIENVNNDVVTAAAGSKERRTRPPNGFLGFCHIHRNIVSQRNERQENRAVTRILGVWWSLLTAEEKGTYREKTAQYKTLFMKANPGYQWYKRPRSTGNTPVTRQSNRRGRKIDARVHTPGAITPGKLADVSQMGGLSSLMTVEQRKRTEINIASIDEEHNYLKTAPINNNSMTMADLNLQSTLTQHAFKTSEEENEVVEDTGIEEEDLNGNLQEEERNSEADNEVSGASGSEVTTNERPDQPSFHDVLKACPVYSYDEYLIRKQRANALNKRNLTKKHKRQRRNSKNATDENREVVLKGKSKKKKRSGVAARVSRSNRKKKSGTLRPQRMQLSASGAASQRPDLLTTLASQRQNMIPGTVEPQRQELKATITHETIYNPLALLVNAAATVEKMSVDEWIK